MEYAVETIQISKSFPQNKRFRDLLFPSRLKAKTTALKNISLQAPKGEIFCLLGPNGAGKTSLIKILCTLVLPTSGNALVNGYDVQKHPKEVRRAIGYVISDERSFYWRLTAYQNLNFFGILNNISSSILPQKIKQVMNLVGLDYSSRVMFKDFSLGIKQKLAIARAMLSEPQILFMDEPTSALDPSSANQLRSFIADEMVGKQGKTIFLASHNLREVEEIGHRIAIIHEGQIKACAPLNKLSPLFKGMNKFIITVKNVPSDLPQILQQQIPDISEITILAQSEEKLEMAIDLKNKVEISEIVSFLVQMGGKIEKCIKKEIPLYEIYAKYTGEKILRNKKSKVQNEKKT